MPLLAPLDVEGVATEALEAALWPLGPHGQAIPCRCSLQVPTPNGGPGRAAVAPQQMVPPLVQILHRFDALLLVPQPRLQQPLPWTEQHKEDDYEPAPGTASGLPAGSSTPTASTPQGPQGKGPVPSPRQPITAIESLGPPCYPRRLNPKAQPLALLSEPS